MAKLTKEQRNEKGIDDNIDGNFYHNERKNLCILCHRCHNAIHDNNNKKETRFQNGHKLNQHKPIPC